MEFKKLDLQKSHKVGKGNFLKRKIKKFKKILILFFLLLTLALAWIFFSSTSSVSNFIFSVNPLKPAPERINVLLLGNAGGGHDGPQLTDSIIVASYHLKNHKVTLISIPRDLWLDDINVKANAAYEVGDKKGEGLKFAKKEIGAILGIPIDYSVRLDFDGFAKAVDLVGGVDVEVPNTFDDVNYPITDKEKDLCGYQEQEVDLTEDQIKALNLPSPPLLDSMIGSDPLKSGKRKVFVDPSGKIATESGVIVFKCRFEHIRFEKGITHMDGETALKFVRSRMGTNGEGSDFARSRRQQLVLQAFRSKALSVETLSNPSKIAGVVSTLGSSVEYDIPASKYLEFYKMIKNIDGVESLVLGDLKVGEPLLITPPPADYGGAFVLIPKDKDFNQIQRYLKQALDPNFVKPSATPTASVVK